MTDYVAVLTEVLWSKNLFTSLPLNRTSQSCVFSVVTTLDKLQFATFFSLFFLNSQTVNRRSDQGSHC